MNKAVVEGVLAVKDVDKFKEILINGFGKRKAYGYGLMTIVPIAERR
ncbi:MAG: type I-E CRISPR-associated protein Cas6/Cse3/CasE [Finegoldia magna]|nr:type I-E CRISPR-associated protein Cas6/Cse3/CasE [Finegoldia magna]